LELSEELTSLRTDAMLNDMSTKEIRKSIDDTALKVRIASKRAGSYRIKYLPAQSTINDIRSYLKEYQIQTGVRVDFVMIDYLDLLMPVSAKVSPNDLFIKDKYVSEELRNLSKELGMLMITASQLNRSAVEEVEFDHSHISGGISKINTADNVFGIFTSRAMRERGKYQIQCMKSRSSTGVGQKIDLDYNMETMRITDPGISENTESVYKNTASEVMKQIKPVTQSNAAAPAKNIGIESNKLKQMLAGLKTSNQV
jgi:replicative DNA helicase